ncbi:MAG: RecX family transcriptional regulator [Firmicutes bacterium]|nr:RecX family transcriptional regulator [Bacillota bacterium]
MDAFDKAANFLAYRMRSEKEVRDYLTKKQYAPAAIDDAVERLKEYRYVDDAEFARQYIDAYRKRWGVLKIRYGLKSAGIDAQILQDALSEMPDQEDEAYALAVKYQKNKPDMDTRKLYAHLAQKGFNADTVRTVLEMLKNEQQS